MLFYAIYIFFSWFPILKIFKPWIRKSDVNNDPLQKRWSWFFEKWVFLGFRFITYFEKWLHLWNSILMSMVTLNAYSRFSSVIKTWKIRALNRRTIWIFTFGLFYFKTKLNCFFFRRNVISDSNVSIFPIFVLFVVQLLEKVFSKDLHHLDGASVSTTYLINNLFPDNLWVDIWFIENYKRRNVSWVLRRIIKPKIIVCWKWFDIKDNSYQLISCPLKPYSLNNPKSK